MNRYPSHLSRNELYSYGFKEGQPWAEDRQSLESALRAMAHLERDIQQNYIQNRSSGFNSGSYSPAHLATRHHSTASTGGYFSPQYPTPDLCLTRSNESDSSSDSSDQTPWSGNGYCNSGYRGPTDFSDKQVAGRYQAPVSHRSSSGLASRSQTRSYSGQYYAPPLDPSRSSHRSSSFHEKEDSRNFSDAQQYPSAPSTPSRNSSRNSGDAHSQNFSPSHMQLVRRGHSERSRHQDSPNEAHYNLAAPLASPDSANWSMNTTHDTASSERTLSITSSQEMYSDDSAYSGYTASSGYVESYDYDVASHNHYRYSYHHDSEEEDRDFMSDSVASDEGVYYSSGDELEYDDGVDVYSDDSEPEDDGSYDSD